MEQLPCSTIVYRAMARKNWIDSKNKVVLPAAFIRRPPPKDESGLSVDVDSPASGAQILNDCYGVVSLHVGRLRDIGLDVGSTHSSHSNIERIPRKEDDPTKAEWFASQLAKQARIVPAEKWDS